MLNRSVDPQNECELSVPHDLSPLKSWTAGGSVGDLVRTEGPRLVRHAKVFQQIGGIHDMGITPTAAVDIAIQRIDLCGTAELIDGFGNVRNICNFVVADWQPFFLDL